MTSATIQFGTNTDHVMRVPQELADKIVACLIPERIQATWLRRYWKDDHSAHHLYVKQDEGESLLALDQLLKVEPFQQEIKRLLSKATLCIDRSSTSEGQTSEYDYPIPPRFEALFGYVEVQHIQLLEITYRNQTGVQLIGIRPASGSRAARTDGKVDHLMRIKTTFARGRNRLWQCYRVGFNAHAECHLPANNAPEAIQRAMRSYTDRCLRTLCKPSDRRSIGLSDVLTRIDTVESAMRSRTGAHHWSYTALLYPFSQKALPSIWVHLRDKHDWTRHDYRYRLWDDWPTNLDAPVVRLTDRAFEQRIRGAPQLTPAMQPLIADVPESDGMTTTMEQGLRAFNEWIVAPSRPSEPGEQLTAQQQCQTETVSSPLYGNPKAVRKKGEGSFD